MDNKKNFLDSSTITTLVIIAAFWIGWSYYMDMKYPKKDVTTAQAEANKDQGKDQTKSVATPPEVGIPDSKAKLLEANLARPSESESFTNYSGNELSFEVSSLGMGLKDIDIKKFKNRDEQPIVLGRVQTELPFSTYALASNQPVNFKISQTDPNTFRGDARIGDVEITKTMKIHPENYTIDVEIEAKNANQQFTGLVTYLSDLLVDQKRSGFLAPPIEKQEIYFLHDDKQKRLAPNSEKELKADEKNVALLAVDIHYFALAIAENSEIYPDVRVSLPVNAKVATAALVYAKPASSNAMKIHYTAYAGPKSFDIMNAADERLGSVIDYGMFAVIARPLLRVMKFFYGLVGNVGFAIILLTLLVRLVVMPANIYSFKSMKVMQKLQPEMKTIREKYKSDPVQQNAKVMELMKANKANPLGGCLPMLLQLPVFFALYQTLGQSIELYREPFVFWIHDLSFRDPYFVLPVLMGITMFIQQKITPSNMDPQQAKIMLFMPIMFTFFMISLPSGLTLYIFVSTLFGITQQYLFLREKTPNHTQMVKA